MDEQQQRAQKTIDLANEVLRSIRAEPPAPKRALTTMEFIEVIRPGILELQEKGYTINQIADMVADKAKFPLSAATLKNCLQRAKAKAGTRKTKKTRTAKVAPAPITETQEAITTAPEAEGQGA